MKSRLRIRFLHLAYAWSLVSTSVEARTWHIRPGGTGDAATIQAGLDSAQAGDEVVLAPGTYSWTLQAASGPSMIRMKREVLLRGEVGAASTILDAERRGRVVECTDVGDARIEGLTITNGCVNAYEGLGGGILSTGDSRLAIAHCVIRGNEASGQDGAGGGIHCSGGSIASCEIEDNLAAGQRGAGGGVYCQSAVIRDCTIRGNRVSGGGEGGAGGGGIAAVGANIVDCMIESNLNFGGYYGAEGGGGSIRNCTMSRCMVMDNRTTGNWGVYGGGLESSGSTIGECVFVANYVRGGGGFGVEVWGGGAIATRFTYQPENPNTITNCTFIGNVAEQDRSIGIAPVGGILLQWGGDVRNCIFAENTGAACHAPTAVFSCNDLFSNSGSDAVCGMDAGGNFNADPQFCAVDPISSRNVTLQADSPCSPGDHSACGLIGAGPVGCGNVSVRERTWTSVKSLYR